MIGGLLAALGKLLIGLIPIILESAAVEVVRNFISKKLKKKKKK